MTDNFYDKVALRFGGYGYGTGPRYKSGYPAGNPERIFKEKLLGLSSKNKIALDIGCADGKFTLSIAPSFQKIYGIDTSKVNLNIAESFNKDARHTSFEDSLFDIAYCRRGPSYYEEYHRVLKTKGHYLEIGIGEMDTVELKKIFGRGQNYGKWDKSTSDKNLKELQDLGFQVVFVENYHYFEYYPSHEELDLFLQGVPIFEDFDSEKDKVSLQKYVKQFSTDIGIQLSRHRLVMVMQKVG